MNHLSPDYPKLEAATRQEIDQKLEAAGWVIQDKKRLNLYASLGVAVREMDTDTGPADCMLFVDGKACGIVEAKREGTNLGDVALQSRRYAVSHTRHIERWADDLPITYEATNHEIRFCDWRDPYERSRYVFHFHRPETLKSWLEEADTLHARLQQCQSSTQKACVLTKLAPSTMWKVSAPSGQIAFADYKQNNC